MQNSANSFVSQGSGWRPKSLIYQPPKNLQNTGFGNIQRTISEEELERFAEASASLIPEPLVEPTQAEYTILKEYDLAKDPFGVYRLQITTRNEKPFVNIARFYQVRETGYYQPTRKQIWLPVEAWRGLCLRIGAVNQELKKQLNGQSIFAGGNRNAAGSSTSITSGQTLFAGANRNVAGSSTSITNGPSITSISTITSSKGSNIEPSQCSGSSSGCLTEKGFNNYYLGFFKE